MNGSGIILGNKSTGTSNSKNTLEILEILRRVNEEGKNLAVIMCDTNATAHVEWMVFMCTDHLIEEMKLGKYHHIDDEITSRETKRTS